MDTETDEVGSIEDCCISCCQRFLCFLDNDLVVCVYIAILFSYLCHSCSVLSLMCHVKTIGYYETNRAKRQPKPNRVDWQICTIKMHVSVLEIVLCDCPDKKSWWWW